MWTWLCAGSSPVPPSMNDEPDLSVVRVCERRCKTCIFGSNSPISARRRQDYMAKWRNDDTFQNCHYGTTSGDRALMCRGFYDWCDAVGWHPLILQLGARLGKIRFVPVPEIL